MGTDTDADELRLVITEEDFDLWQAIDVSAREFLGMSGEEFARAYKAGEFDDRLDEGPISGLVMMLPR